MTGRPEGPELTNPRSERVRAVRALSGRSARLRHGLYLVEGPQGVREAVRWAPESVRDVYLTGAAQQRYPEIADGARVAGLRVHVASPEVLEAMSTDAQGVLAVGRVAASDVESVLAGAPRLVAVLSAVRDPGNAGTVIRAADAAGADAVVVAGASVDVHNPKVVRSTVGSFFHLPVVTGVDLPAAVHALRQAGLTILAADGAGPVDLDDLLDHEGHESGGVNLSRPTAWVFGNEAWGLRPEDTALADAVVRVPIHGRAESLNLATAAAVCLYASARALRGRRVPTDRPPAP